jgi:hypothetical protein
VARIRKVEIAPICPDPAAKTGQNVPKNTPKQPIFLLFLQLLTGLQPHISPFSAYPQPDVFRI